MFYMEKTLVIFNSFEKTNNWFVVVAVVLVVVVLY